MFNICLEFIVFYSSNDIIKINCIFNLMNLFYYIYIEFLNFYYCKIVLALWLFC